MNVTDQNKASYLFKELIFLMREYEDALMNESVVEITDPMLEKIRQTYEQIEELKQATYN